MKKKVESKKITIDVLAIMMNNSFEGLEKRVIGVIKEEIEGVKNQIQGVNKRIDDFAENKASKITYKEIENRVGFIEKNLAIKK